MMEDTAMQVEDPEGEGRREDTVMQVEDPEGEGRRDTHIYSIDDMDFFKQLLLLGISRYSDYNDIVRIINILIKNITDDQKQVERLFSMIESLSTSGRCMNQDAIYLCLVMCYVHSEQMGKAEMEKKVNRLCRIPTHLFVLLKILKEYLDRGARINEPCNTVEFYEAILDDRGGHDQKQGKNTKAAKPDDKPSADVGANPPQKISNFISKHKFISKWYCDPRKKASDLLLLLTKYQNREGWESKLLIKYSHPKFQPDDPELKEKNVVMQYFLSGFKKVEKDYNDFIENGAKGNEVESRVYHFIKLLEDIKLVMKEKEEENGARAKRISELIRNSRRFEDPTREEGPVMYTFNSSISVASPVHSLQNSFIEDVQKVSRLHLTVEHLPSSMYKEKVVFDELIKDMPMGAMLNQISHMSYLGLFDDEDNVEEDGQEDGQEEDQGPPIKIVEDAFTNPYRIFPFVHPFQILKALAAYQKGQSGFGTKVKEWDVKPTICAILKEAFFLSLERKNPRPLSFNNCLVCIDDSQPMHQQGFLGIAMFNAAMAAVALATAIERSGRPGRENSVYICGSTSCEKLEQQNSLFDRLEYVRNNLGKEQSNLAAPIREAITAGSNLSAVIVFTKSIPEHLCGESVYDTFVELRTKMAYGPDTGTKLVVVSMGANGKVVGDLLDPNVHMVCGGDADVLKEMDKFVNVKNPDDYSQPELFERGESNISYE